MDGIKRCSKCGMELGTGQGIEKFGRLYCLGCSARALRDEVEWKGTAAAVIPDQIAAIIVTTTPAVEGRRVERYLGIVTAQVVLGVSVFKDIYASWKSFSGGRVETLEKELYEGYASALTELKTRAVVNKADAIIGVQFASGVEVAGEAGVNDKMLVVTATGTLVKLADVQDIASVSGLQ